MSQAVVSPGLLCYIVLCSELSPGLLCYIVLCSELSPGLLCYIVLCSELVLKYWNCICSVLVSYI